MFITGYLNIDILAKGNSRREEITFHNKKAINHRRLNDISCAVYERLRYL